MVGRCDEVRQALTALGDAAEFRGVVLMGDSGVGKSTLAHALADILESRGLNVRFVPANGPASCHRPAPVLNQNGAVLVLPPGGW